MPQKYRDPERRNGHGAPHLKTCYACKLRVPEEMDMGYSVPCSDLHTRCIRCGWPVANAVMHESGLCELCMGFRSRRNYQRRSTEDCNDVLELNAHSKLKKV